MQAIVCDQYGPAEVLRLEALPTPAPAPDKVLVEVHATSVTTADWRLRSADFGAGMGLIGRLALGVFKPRNRVTGREFSGKVVAVGSAVRHFEVGDDVFGVQPKGANAEFIAVPESAAIGKKPAELTHAEAAALPFGAITSLAFMIDIARVQPAEHVLINGASGGVGAYAIQLAKHLGAEVTAVCSTKNLEFARSLGADHVIDYTVQEPWKTGATWDVVVDCVGKTTVADYRTRLSARGRHAFIEGSLRQMLQALTSRLRPGPKVVFGVAADNREAFERLTEFVKRGAFVPVVGHRFAMTDVVAAHQLVESRHRRGAVILDWPAARVSPGPRLRNVG